jgi:2-keto-4-pentenoate hydratase
MATAGLKQIEVDARHATYAARLRDCYQSGEAMAPISLEFAGATIEDAYAIQAENTRFWENAGRRIVGAKIGLTAKTVQAQLGVDQPDFGHLFADMAVNDGDTIAIGRLLQPKVEAEIAFVLKRPIDVQRLTTAELIDSVAYAVPALEIVDSRITDWKIGIVDTVADNASSGLFVLGTRAVPLNGLDLRLSGMVLEKNGDPVSFGAGAACLGNPLHALGWLATRMSLVGRPLAEGDVILAGALGPMVPVKPGDSVEARIEDLGTVRVRFGKE